MLFFYLSTMPWFKVCLPFLPTNYQMFLIRLLHAPYKLAKSHFVRTSFPRNLFSIACYKYRVGNLSVLL